VQESENIKTTQPTLEGFTRTKAVMAIFNKNGLVWGELSDRYGWDFLGVSVVAIDGNVVFTG